MAIAGKVAITPKGEWNAQTAYTKLDLVFYDNASYVAIQPSTGVEPTNESYWMLMVQSAGGADLEGIIDGSIQVGNAKTLDGNEAEYFAPKEDLAKYLPLTGGTVKTPNRRAMNVSNTGGADVSIGYRHGDTLLGEIGVKDGGAYYIDSSNKVNNILHTGNKPTGTYTGNGDATARTINIGGFGRVLFVRNTRYSVLVLDAGAIAIDGNGNITGIPYAEAHFVEGVFTCATTNIALNQSGIINTWQLL